MIPVKDAAGGAAAILHEPHTERTPEQHADQIAHVKRGNEQHGKPIRTHGLQPQEPRGSQSGSQGSPEIPNAQAFLEISLA